MTIRILQIEDNPADVELMADAFDALGADVALSSAADGAEGIAVLKRQGHHENTPLPDLILLDLNLPEKSGREVLSTIKSDATLRRLPVIVLTTSRADDDVRACYELGANAFLAKPHGLKAVRELVAAIHAFWVASNIYPAGNRGQSAVSGQPQPRFNAAE